ncbi:MAG: DUF1570 domain-containing protein [Planctomycetes bacterium]|nr:DUF1570 domain-containing protein [Planctomycetota bacterium]
MTRLAPILFLLLCALPSLADRAAAEAAMRDGQAAMQRKDMQTAIEAFTRAVDADPAWGTAWGNRGLARYRVTNFNGAIEDFSHAIELEPQTPDWHFHRVQTYLYLDRIAEAVEESESMMKRFPGNAMAASLHGRALVRSGEVDRGLAVQEKAFVDGGRDVQLPPRSDAWVRKADWEALRAGAEQAIAGGAPSTIFHFHRVMALVELGQFDAADAAARELEAKTGMTVTTTLCRVTLAASPRAGAHFKAAFARDGADALLKASANPESINAAARAFLLCGDPQRCLDTLVTRARHTNFETLFWLGAAYWKLGKLPEARVVLSDARRLNPYLLKHAPRVEGIGDFLASLDREIGKEGDGQDRGRLGHELATHLMTVAEIEALVKRYRFAQAAAEYGKLQGALKSDVRKAEVAARLPEVKAMAGALAKIVTGVNSGKLKLSTSVAGIPLAIRKADDAVFEFTIPKGEGKVPWAFLGAAAFCELAVQAALTPDELFGLGCLAWEADERAVAIKLFEEALKKKSDLRKSLDAFVARRRGVAAPGGGFVLFRGQYVTAEEKANLEKGLVFYGGEWVTAADKDQLSKGLIKVEGKWVPGEEAELLRRGYRRHEGKWMSREEYESLRGEWANAWTEDTPHWLIRTNEGESFAKDLVELAEAAYGAFEKFHGAEAKLPGKDKMTLYAFRDYEGYRKHCVEMKAEEFLGAAGFARSDSIIAAGWNKTHNRQQFLQTMVHEAAHLFYSKCAPAAQPPSWYSEAMATYFEGFEWDGKTWKFGGASESRLPFVRDAMKGGRHIPLADLLGGEAIKIINSDAQKALLFYAECWSINFFLVSTENKARREAYAEYRKAIAAGKTDPLTKFFPDAAQLEKDWVKFVSGL